MQQRFKCVDIHNVKHAYVEREGSIYFIPSFLGLKNILPSLETTKNKWFLEDGTLKDEIIYPNKRGGVYLIKWEYYFFYLTSCSNDDILPCDYKRKLAKLVSSGEIGRRVNQFLEGDTVSNMIIDDTEHHDQNVLSQSSTCDIKIHESSDFSQDTLNDVDMDDSFSQGTLNYVDMDQISDMDDSFSQGNITNFSQYSFESFGNNTQNSFASTSQDKNNLQLGNDFLSQLSSSEYDLSFGPINLDYELQEQQSNTIFIKDFLNEQKPLYPNTSSSHKQDNTNFKFFDLSTIKESTFGVESSYFKGISNRYCIKNRGTFKNVDMAEIHAIVNCFGNKYYPPTSSDKGRDLFKYTIPIIHQNLLTYMKAETNRTYESDLFDFLKSNCGQDLLLKYVSTKEKISGKLKNELKSLFTIELSPIDIIQSKDECEMSLNTLRNLIISLQEKIGTKKNNLYELLFGPSNVRKYNSLLNRAIEEVLGIKIFDVGENGSYVRIEDVLKLMIKAIIGNGGNFTNKNGKKLLKVRFSFDGREIPWAKIGFFLVPLGFSDIFPTQHWKSVFAFLLYNGEENLEDYLKYCDCILEFTCQDECIIQVDDEEYIIELILVPDLKALRSSKVTYSFDRVSKLDEQTINTILAKDLKINPTTLSKQQKLINVYKYVNSTSVVKNYTKWNKNQLQQELKNRNLKSSGSKDLLIHWLKEDDDKFLPIAFKQSEEYMVGMMDIIIGTLVEDTLSDEMKLLVKVPKIGKKRRRKKSKTNKSKKQKTSNNSSKKIDISDANQRDIIQDAIKVLEDKHKLKKQYKDLVQYFKEKGCNVCVFCPARSRHIRFSLMNPACHAFHVHYKYNTLFNIEAKAYCSLHACERIVESTLALTTNQKEEVRSWMINYFENTFNKEYLEDKGHTFKKKLEYYPIKLKPKNNILNEDTEDGFIKLSFSMILWKHCSVIVDTSDIWLKDLEEAFSDSKELAKTEPVRNLWNLLKELWVMLEYDSKAIEECKKEKFEKEWTFFKKFGNAFLKAFGNHSCTSHYLHIVLCHTVYVWENFGSLCILSNQGTESSNRGHKRIGEQMGQGAIKPNRHAVLQFQLRCLIYMIPEYRKKCNDYIESIFKLKTAKKLSKNEKTQPIQMKSTQSTDKKSNSNQKIINSTENDIIEIKDLRSFDDNFVNLNGISKPRVDSMETIRFNLSDDIDFPDGEIVSKDVQYQPTGLIRITGTPTCFVNVAVQSLFYSMSHDELFDHQCEKYLLNSETMKKNCGICLLKEHKCTVSKNGICKICNIEPHDHFKFNYNKKFLCPLCILHEQFVQMKVNPNPILPSKILSHDYVYLCGKNEQDCPTYITRFYLYSLGTIKRSRKSTTCECISTTEDTFTTLRSFYDNDCIIKGIKQYLQKETIEMKCFCSSNDSNTKFIQTTTITNYPDVLQITVDRQTLQNNLLSKNKITDNIKFYKSLKLEKYIDDSETYEEFTLTSVIVHKGTTANSGHYYCFVKYNDCWWEIDDDMVQKVTWKKVRSSQAAVLFYKKKNIKTTVEGEFIENEKNRIINGISKCKPNISPNILKDLTKVIMELSTQLNIHNPVVVKVRGDGNCLTNAISLTDPFRSSREISLLTLKSYERNSDNPEYSAAYWFPAEPSKDTPSVEERLDPTKCKWKFNLDAGLIAHALNKNIAMITITNRDGKPNLSNTVHIYKPARNKNSQTAKEFIILIFWEGCHFDAVLDVPHK